MNRIDAGPAVLIVEDEPAQLELLAYNLNVEGYRTFKAGCVEDAEQVLDEEDIDLLLLDWMLPDKSGPEFCTAIKSSAPTKGMPVIMLTARTDEKDKVHGLDCGADDYMAKPYSIRELLARVRSNLRRARHGETNEVLSYDLLKMDLGHHKVSYGDKPVKLGPIEFKLLRLMLGAPGRVWSRSQLLDRVWETNVNVDTRTVDVHIGRLRGQLRKVCDVDLIRTVRGFGYSLDLGQS